MSHRTVSTDSAPAAIGAYSQACIAGKLVFISGQIPLNPSTGEMITNDIAEATRQCMRNIFAIAKAAGDGAHLVKVSIFLIDMGEFGEVNGAYAEFFDENPPARECVAVKTLPKNAPIEISAIAVLP
ncbi:MAG TPA: reactive intermediate/imine deaminase [candidate division Zixibacteria bacterium]|nr:reactive intermediate/imine deaminase [candidate division Zixibacteria bacterium]